MRIVGINIPDNKRVEVALSYIYGVGFSRSREIMKAAHLPNKLVKELTAEEINKIQDYIDRHFKVEGALRQIIKQNIQRLKDIQAYRGSRHARRLPARGQRTRTNSRTVRGNIRKTAGSGKRKVELK